MDATRERESARNGSGLALSSLGVRTTSALRSKDFLVMGVSAILNHGKLQLLTSTKALAYVTVSTPVVFRTAEKRERCIFFFFILYISSLRRHRDDLLFRRQFPLRAHAALVVIFFGTLMVYARQDFNVGAMGYTWLLGNTAAYTANNIYNK